MKGFIEITIATNRAMLLNVSCIESVIELPDKTTRIVMSNYIPEETNWLDINLTYEEVVEMIRCSI